MAAITVRDLPDDVHRALQHRAKQNGRSMEAEARYILQDVAIPKKILTLGKVFADIIEKYKHDLYAEDAEGLVITRDKTPVRIAVFE